MDTDPGDSPLDRLHPSARTAPLRVRVGVGAAVLLLLGALVVAVLVSALNQGSGSEVVRPQATEVSRPGDGSSAAAGSADAGSDGVLAGERALLFVHVLGAVNRPGLFELHEGARVVDAIAAAGGLTEAADPAGANLARLVSDGEQLYLPELGEAQPGAPPGGSAAAPGAGGASGLINLNTATVSELDTLPRIGPALAQRIIDYRDSNGRFQSVDDLLNVAGFGQKTVDALKDLVTT